MTDLQDFIELHERALFRFAMQLTHSEDESQDLLQDTWMKCLTFQQMLETMTEQKQRSWLFTVLKNRWLDILRKRKLESMVVSQATLPIVTNFPAYRMEHHLEKLPTLEREIVYQKYWLGSNSREIAADLDIPEGTVRWRLKLAMDKLKKMIEQSEKEERCLL
ncbi:MAG: RNA polymerase sigma factor [Candidatus Syntrophosphaera sp.]